MIYFIQQGRDGPLKIGISNNPEKRLKDLQVANHDTLYLLATRRGSNKLEARLHKRFAPYHIRGEWYRLEGDLLSFMRKGHSMKKHRAYKAFLRSPQTRSKGFTPISPLQF